MNVSSDTYIPKLAIACGIRFRLHGGRGGEGLVYARRVDTTGAPAVEALRKSQSTDDKKSVRTWSSRYKTVRTRSKGGPMATCSLMIDRCLCLSMVLARWPSGCKVISRGVYSYGGLAGGCYLVTAPPHRQHLFVTFPRGYHCMHPGVSSTSFKDK